MSLEDTTYELIDQYLQGELPEDHPFVQRLKQDEELALEVEVRRSIQDVVVDYRLLEVERLLSSRRKEFSEQNSYKWSRLLWSLPILLLGTLAYLYLAEPKQENAIKSIKAPAKESTLPPTRRIQDNEPVLTSTNSAKPQNIVKGEKPIAAKIAPETKFLATQEASSVTLAEPKSISTVAEPEYVAEPEQKVELVHQKTASIPPANPCVGIRIRAFVEEQRPCFGNAEGQLAIKGARGGKAPYQFSLDGKPFQEESKFIDLKQGEYDIVVKDANNCETVIYEKYPLKSKSCTSFSEQVFNPNFGPWEVPTNREKLGTLTVFDLHGQTIYSKTFDKAEKLTWGGTQNSGELLVPGAYIYSIKYSDGEMEQGKITITY